MSRIPTLTEIRAESDRRGVPELYQEIYALNAVPRDHIKAKLKARKENSDLYAAFKHYYPSGATNPDYAELISDVKTEVIGETAGYLIAFLVAVFFGGIALYRMDDNDKHPHKRHSSEFVEYTMSGWKK